MECYYKESPGGESQARQEAQPGFSSETKEQIGASCLRALVASRMRGGQGHSVGAVPPGPAPHTFTYDCRCVQTGMKQSKRSGLIDTCGKYSRALEALGQASRPRGQKDRCGVPWALTHARFPVLSPQPPAPCSVAGMAST